jgi:hypothetical protein
MVEVIPFHLEINHELKTMNLSFHQRLPTKLFCLDGVFKSWPIVCGCETPAQNSASILLLPGYISL